MAFNLAAKLAGVSKLNTQQPQIEYLPFDLVDPDPDNFYSLERIDELADSIAAVGLLDPIRVRPNGERYTVTSGHRRRAAIQLLIDGGEAHWKTALPCIVDRGEATKEFRELQLIYANSATRRLSSAELSRQAERVEALLVALKEQGYDFPGRMQEHVAQAMSVNASKLKRLHAIRNHAQEYVLDAFDEGKINEAVAYELQKLPMGWQKALMIDCLRKQNVEILTAVTVGQYAANANRLVALKCEITPGTPCAYGSLRIETALAHSTTGGSCTSGGCCLKCRFLTSCEDACPKCETARREAQAKAVEDKRRQREEAERYAAERQAEKARNMAEAAAFWGRVRKAAEASGEDLSRVFAALDYGPADVEEMLDYASGKEPDEYGVWQDLIVDCLAGLVKELNCSADYLLGIKEQPTAALKAAPPAQENRDSAPERTWQTGTPEEKGCYAVRFKVSESAPGEIQSFSRWDGWQWRGVRSNKPVAGMIAVGWWPIPEV